MKLQLIDPISNQSDIELNIPIILHNLAPKDKCRIANIKTEIEIELGFNQVEHLRNNETIIDTPGITTQRIDQLIQIVLDKDQSYYPIQETPNEQRQTEKDLNPTHRNTEHAPKRITRRPKTTTKQN